VRTLFSAPFPSVPMSIAIAFMTDAIAIVAINGAMRSSLMSNALMSPMSPAPISARSIAANHGRCHHWMPTATIIPAIAPTEDWDRSIAPDTKRQPAPIVRNAGTARSCKMLINVLTVKNLASLSIAKTVNSPMRPISRITRTNALERNTFFIGDTRVKLSIKNLLFTFLWLRACAPS
jgi:hypothetical protein